MIVSFVCDTHISMSVQQTMEDVVLTPAVVTRWVVSHVPVIMDMLELGSLVLVSWIKHVLGSYFSHVIYLDTLID